MTHTPQHSNLSRDIQIKSERDSPPLLFHLPEPVGWIALTIDELRTAQKCAHSTLGLSESIALAESMRAEPRALLSPDDAARVLAVDPSWLLTRARENTIPHVRLGKYVRFNPEEIIEFGRRGAIKKTDSRTA